MRPLSSPLPQFEGIRNTVHRREKPLSQAAFERLVAAGNSPYTGKLPGTLAKTFENPRDFLKGLDEATESIRKQRKSEGRYPAHVAFFVDNVPVRLTHIGSGALGAAYHLQTGDQDMVLKIFHQKKAPDDDTRIGLGNWAEQRIGLTLSQIRFRNFSTYHLGNPQQGWILYERFTPNMNFWERPGECLEDYQVTLTDHDEFINGVDGRGRVDHGGILIDHRHPLEKHAHPWSEMMARLKAAKKE